MEWRIGDKYKHVENGKIYSVLGTSNMNSTRDDFPPTVHYRADGDTNIWSRPIVDFLKRTTPVDIHSDCWLYLLVTDCNRYDMYDSCVVVATSEDEAKRIHPSEHMEYKWSESGWKMKRIDGSYSTITNGHSGWSEKLEDIKVVKIGKADRSLKAGQVLCSSFNAG